MPNWWQSLGSYPPSWSVSDALVECLGHISILLLTVWARVPATGRHLRYTGKHALPLIRYVIGAEASFAF